MYCQHDRGDWITEQGYWLCADCFAKMDARPTKYGITVLANKPGEQQQIVWQAVIAKADGLSFNNFLRAMVRRYMARTRPQIDRDAAYNAAIDYLQTFSDPYGDPCLVWTAEGAQDLVDDDMQEWERSEGNT